MSSTEQALKQHRESIDAIDDQILELLKQRKSISLEILASKIQNGLPIYIADREIDKINDFRSKALLKGLDPDWSEDFLRMIMSASRANQSMQHFPKSTQEHKKILFVGGSGGMGSLYAKIATASGYEVAILDKNDWDRVEVLTSGVDMVIITVPIHLTESVIDNILPFLTPETILADFTSNKHGVMKHMLHAWKGPVLGMHPMHGPDVMNLSKQLMLICDGREADKSEWFVQQCVLWGMRVKRVDPEKHDHAMHLIQGLRHFVALLHGSFMQKFDLRPEDIIDFSSPIYRAELMMTGRIFAQDPELYADIVFSNQERLELLELFREHHNFFADMIQRGDKDKFVKVFKSIHDFFGDFAPQALHESGYLINRLSDRFA
jgi:chorismate mutase/prephenate dehydrogenase